MCVCVAGEGLPGCSLCFGESGPESQNEGADNRPPGKFCCCQDSGRNFLERYES